MARPSGSKLIILITMTFRAQSGDDVESSSNLVFGDNATFGDALEKAARTAMTKAH